jgi:hypothetical protein
LAQGRSHGPPLAGPLSGVNRRSGDLLGIAALDPESTLDFEFLRDEVVRSNALAFAGFCRGGHRFATARRCSMKS